MQRLLQLVLVTALFHASAATPDDLKLPNLGESSTSLFSPEQEYQLGRAWLRVFRSQAPTLDDPLLQDYLEDLIYRLVTHSELQDRRIDVVIVDNPVINAFAVPGGVIGVHTGLLLYAQSEDELGTVLAHEIAHLSQRHFSRRIEHAQATQPITLAGLLAGAVLIATTGGAAGMAALSAAQAAAMDAQLRHSRSAEQEADRIGMQTMVKAGMDPHAAPAMFERMLQSSRYSSANRIPEFMRTHPLSESRIADTRNRARQYPKQVQPPSLSFQLMRARMQVHHADTPQRAAEMFRDSLDGQPLSEAGSRYGLALALIAAGRPAEAQQELDRLIVADPTRVEYVIAQAELDMSIGEAQSAARLLQRELKLYPGNHALTMAYARALLMNQQAHIAEEVLIEQSRVRPEDPGLWYLLAEVQGLSGNIAGLHQARAEYFILNGVLDEAERQLNYAMKLSKNDYHVAAQISQRLKDISNLRSRMEDFV
ncbi:MAG: M48 family metalloprotease [Halieaceae bacterium]|jgi:predicted Zn-dependent protease|nr:M48 family metalloprotease [Halieaceae bacterium]